MTFTLMTCCLVGYALMMMMMMVNLLVVFLLSTEPEAGVVRAGPEGAGPQRTSVTLHLPCAAPGPAQRPRHTSQNLHTPQKVRVALQEEEGYWASCIYLLICIISQFTSTIHFLYLPPVNHIPAFFSACSHLVKKLFF